MIRCWSDGISHELQVGQDRNVISRDCFSIAEFSSLKGLSESTIRRRIRDRSLPYFQPGGSGTKILIPADALQRDDSAISSSSDLRVEDLLESAVPHDQPLPRVAGRQPLWKQNLSYNH